MQIRQMRIFFLVVVMMVASTSAKGQGPSQSGQANSKPTVIRDTQGNEALPGTKCLVERRLKNGELKIYKKTDADISVLISDLKAEGVKDKRLLDRKFWMDDDCERHAGNDCGSGSCSSGSCKQTTSGSSTYCRCR